MSETIVELNGQRYKQLPSGWIDADTYLTPPLVIIQELNRRHIKPAKPAKATESRRQSAGPARNRPGHSFTGLQPSDFRTNTKGTSWRRDTSMGGLLSQELRDKTGRDFVQHAVYRRQQVLLGQPPRFDRHNTDGFNLRPAKFFFSLDDVHAFYGFYVEKPDYPNSGSWEWESFRDAIGKSSVRETVDQAASAHDLQWRVVESSSDGNRVRSSWQSPAGPDSWGPLSGAITKAMVDTSSWIDLHLETTMSPEAAIAVGVTIVKPVTAVYLSLLPLYDACGQ